MSATRTKILVLVGLMVVMLATRFPGIASNLHLHDASWAVFFVAGFYLAGSAMWAFTALLLCAVGIDLVAIQHYGISNYCMTAAYWFILPAYGALWAGGAWLRSRAPLSVSGLVALAASALIAVSVCFLLTNGSFYWLGGRVAQPTVQGWIANFAQWYWPFARVALIYIAVAALVHVLVTRVVPSRKPAFG
jgi:hypothetical protein